MIYCWAFLRWGVYNHNIVGENGDFQPLHPKISRNSQTVSNAATVILYFVLSICVCFYIIQPIGCNINNKLSSVQFSTHCCRALTFASARLSCQRCCVIAGFFWTSAALNRRSTAAEDGSVVLNSVNTVFTIGYLFISDKD